MIELYPDQQQVISDTRALWKEHLRILVCAPTGAGKTRMAARMIEGMVERGMRICFTVPRISLIQQTAREFMDLGLEDITLIWGNYDTDRHAKITIASVDTFIRREKLDFDAVFVDECHHRRRQLLEWMTEHPEDRYIGLTATPFAPWIGEYYTGLVKAQSMRWLIDNGRLCEYSVYCPSHPDTSGLKTHSTAYGQDYREADIEQIMGDAKVIGNIVQFWLENGENRLTMVLPVNVAHANKIAIDFNKAGISAEVISASTPTEERERIFKRLSEEITTVLISVNCLTEGFSEKKIACVINARPTKSPARLVQGIGRGLRKKPEGYRFQDCLVFDHSGSCLDLGLPEDLTIDELPKGDDGLSEGQSVIAEAKPEKKPKECPSCKFLKPAGVYVCPKCGFKPVMGQDVETDETRTLVALKPKKESYTMEQKQDWYAQLWGYQKERKEGGKNLSDGWVANTYREKFGCWPKGLNRYAKPVGPDVRNFIKYKAIKWAKGKERANG